MKEIINNLEKPKGVIEIRELLKQSQDFLPSKIITFIDSDREWSILTSYRPGLPTNTDRYAFWNPSYTASSHHSSSHTWGECIQKNLNSTGKLFIFDNWKEFAHAYIE